MNHNIINILILALDHSLYSVQLYKVSTAIGYLHNMKLYIWNRRSLLNKCNSFLIRTSSKYTILQIHLSLVRILIGNWCKSISFYHYQTISKLHKMSFHRNNMDFFHLNKEGIHFNIVNISKRNHHISNTQ